jgi:hypothetical protein
MNEVGRVVIRKAKIAKLKIVAAKLGLTIQELVEQILTSALKAGVVVESKKFENGVMIRSKSLKK